MARKEVVRDWVLLDNWSILIKDAQGKGEELLKETERLIKEGNLPDIEMERVNLSISATLSGIFSKTKEREYLEVKNKDLPRYGIYITARDYGKNLDVQWYLFNRSPQSLFEALKAVPKELRRGLTGGLNLFEEQDLTAFVTAVHHSLLDAVSKIMQGLGQDPSKIDRKSRGFLGVS